MNTSEGLFPPVRDFPVIGIGASAGGLAALEAFFTGLPDGESIGMAFVIVQHRPPDRKSALAELIGRRTCLPVREISDGLPIEVGTVYIAPGSADIAIGPAGFKMSGFPLSHDRSCAIDSFFMSLAHAQLDLACAIVLSGTGTDGTVGIEVIKGQGGLVVAQSPESAEFDGMPKSALSTGLVDFTVPPAQMFPRVQTYFARTISPAATPSETAVDEDKALQEIFELLRRQVGHDFSQYKPGTVGRRLKRRLAIHQLPTLDSYVQVLRDNPREAATLFRDLLIGVTGFFRDREVFQTLETRIIPEIFHAKRPGAGIRAWVAGCATGEEAYSLAMLLVERQEKSKNLGRIQVLATDMDGRSVASARAGVFSPAIASEVAPDRLSRHFLAEPGSNGFRVSTQLREMVVFSEHDLIKDPPFSRLDFISCRNLLIYLDPELQRRLIALFHYALNPGGILLLGSSENAGDSSPFFVPIDRALKLYRRVDTVSGAPVPPLSRFLRSRPTVPTSAGMMERQDGESPGTMRELTERAILQLAVPTAVLINGQGDIVYVHGRAGHFLEPAPDSPGSNNLLKMAREGLRPALQTLLGRVRAGESFAHASGVRVRTNGHFIRAAVSVRSVPIGETTVISGDPRPPWFLVTLEETGQERSAPAESGGALHVEPAGALSQDAETRISTLLQELETKEEHLQATREALEASNEQLVSSNEELQSINEELQATNEELETSKEELQSANEELFTLNAELQTKVTDLSNANNDILNLLAGTGIATIFIDRHLHIMRYTPAVARIINLLPADVGRPIRDLVLNLEGYTGLEQDARRVLENLEVVSQDVRSPDGTWYALKLRPYHTKDGKIEGVAITFSDITERKRAEMSVLASERRFAKLLRNSFDTIVVLDADGIQRYVSASGERVHGFTAAELTDIPVIERMIHPDDQARVIETFRRILEKGDGGVQYRHRRKDGGWVHLEARGTNQLNDPDVNGVVVNVRDITDRVQAEEKQREAYELLSKFIEHSPILAYIQEVSPTQCRAVRTSRNFEELTGIPSGQMDGKTMEELFPKDFAAKISAESWTIHSSGKVTALEEQLNGRSYYTIKFPLTIGEKKLLAGYTIDITERKKAEEKLRESEARYRNLFDSMVNGFALHEIILDETGIPCDYRFLEVNAAFENLTGLRAKDIVGRRVMEILPQTERYWIDTYGRVAMTGEVVHFENYSAALQKHYEVVAYRPAPRQFACVFADVTARRNAEKERWQMAALLEAALAQSPSGIIIADAPDVRIRWANAAALNARGESGNVLTGIDITQHSIRWQTFLPDGSPYPPEELPLSRAVLKGETTTNELAIIRHADGEDRWITANAAPVRGQDGKVVSGVVIFQDITLQRRLEEQLRQEEKMSAIGRLAGGIAHDFNNQLQGILGFAEVLAKDLADPQMQNCAMKILNSASRAAELTRQLLAFSRKGKFLNAPVDVHAVIAEVVALLHRSIDKRITVKQSLEAAAPIVMADPGQFQNAILNLVLNARDAMPEGGCLTLATAVVELTDEQPDLELPPGRYVRIDVSDTGIGMDATTRRRLFEPFFTTKELGKGTGLGLASAYGTVRNHNGTIRVQSESGRGSTFSVFMPLHEAFVPETSVQAPAMASPGKESGRLLIVDDEPIILDTTAAMLRCQGYEIVACQDPSEALETYRRDWRGIDLVIIDLMMPKMSGGELFLALREVNPSIRAILASGFGLDGEAQAILDLGVQGFLQKPFGWQELMEKVKEIMELSG